MTLLADDDRILPAECGFNFRDFGGYATADGRRVKTGLLYRSGVMAFVEEQGRERLATLGLASICDLRSSKERRFRPTVWHEGSSVELWSRDYDGTSADLAAAIEQGNADAAMLRAMMFDLYEEIAYDHAPSFQAMFERLVGGKVPLLVNCSAGKDRTGTAVALVLLALGVPRETILADYVLTARADFEYLLTVTRRKAHAPLTPEAKQSVFAADPAYLETMLKAVETRSGSIESYLESELGVDAAGLERLRELLLTD